MSTASNDTHWSKEEFERRIQAMGKRYHTHHPFHIAMNSGKCTKRQIQGWVANRYYYQISIPLKDAAIMANCPDKETRRQWVQRILDHDGTEDADGGIEAWLRLGEAVGLAREEVISQRLLLPGVKFAVDAYVNFARQATWQEAASSSLTELFAPTLHQKRLDKWPEHYPWIEPTGYAYFKTRLSEARRDVQHGLAITVDYYKTLSEQKRMLKILQFKLDVLWTMLDAMQLAYVYLEPPYHTVGEEC